MFPAWRSPRVSDTSPAVVPNLMSVDPMSALPEMVPKSAATTLPRRHVSSAAIDLCWCMSELSWAAGKHWDAGGATSEVVVVELACFAWFSEKHCLLIAISEGSLSDALTSDLLPVGVVVAIVVAAGPVVDAGVAADAVGVGVCARPLLSPSLSSVVSSSFVSCWYISSTMGFHNRTLALMNQFET